MTAFWKENDVTQQRLATKGNILRVENTPHTFQNLSSAPCVFIVFRFIPTGVPTQTKIKQDKTVCE